MTAWQGETFEYVRLDRRYRYVSEQVSHHPPMSACWAESPVWKYYGEVSRLLWKHCLHMTMRQVDAQNRFMGKSFEIRPTGTAHVELSLPDNINYEGGKTSLGKVTEHYTWKKVTTCVSGFIFGSPTIDHYGDMNVSAMASSANRVDMSTVDRESANWRQVHPDF